MDGDAQNTCVMCHEPKGRMVTGPKGTAICEQCIIDAASALYPQPSAPRVNSYDAGSGFYRRRGPNV